MTSIEQRVMGGVGVIYALRQLTSAVALKIYVLAAAAAALWQLTWVHMIFQNWAHVGAGGTLTFLTYAVEHTHLATQAALAAAVAAAAWLIADAIRSLLLPRPFRRPTDLLLQ